MRESRHGAAVSPSPRAAASGWVLEAVLPNGKQATIAGFGSESEANEWLGSARHAAWLRHARGASFIRTVVAAFECSFDLTLTYTVELAQYVKKWGSAGWLRRVCWCSILYRCLFAATVALLMASGVIAILAAAVAPLGRNERPSGLEAPTPQISAARPGAQARSNEAAETSDPIADLIDRVSSAEAATKPPAGVSADPHNRQQENVKLPPECSPAALFQSHDHGCWLEHDAEKWVPVFGKHHAPAITLKRDGDSKKSHRALGNKGEIPRWFQR